MNPRHVPTLALAVSTIALLDFGAPSFAATWNVTPDGLGDAPTIQDAFVLAAVDDTILVHPGTYFERPIAHKGLYVIGVGGAAATTIDGEGVGSVLQVYIENEAEEFLIEGLRIVGSGTDENFGWPYPALSQSSWHSRIRECELESFQVTNTTMTDCRILGTARGKNGNSASGASVVENCRFEDCRDFFGASGLEIRDSGIVRNCTFIRCDGDGFVPVIGYDWLDSYAAPTIEANLFLDCVGPCVGPAQWPPLRPEAVRHGGSGGFVVIRGNTFVGNEHGPIGPWPGPHGTLLPGTFERNIVTGSAFGVWLPEGIPYALSCNDSFGNGSNWTGFPDPSGIDGNFSADPSFCDPDGDDYTLASNSPCLPGNHPDHVSCGTIGAFGEACGTVILERESWGRVKSRYRETR